LREGIICGPGPERSQRDLVSYWTTHRLFRVLSVTRSDAQAGGGSTGRTVQNSDCPGASKANTTTGNGNKQSPVFNVTGTSFRLKVDSTATSQDPQFAMVNIFVYPEGETVGFVGTFDVEEGRDDSSIINAGPGSFYLNILAANVDYMITVEDCTGTSQGNQDSSTPASQNNQQPENVRRGNRQRAERRARHSPSKTPSSNRRLASLCTGDWPSIRRVPAPSSPGRRAVRVGS
jgi:hypothetical protein